MYVGAAVPHNLCWTWLPVVYACPELQKVPDDLRIRSEICLDCVRKGGSPLPGAGMSKLSCFLLAIVAKRQMILLLHLCVLTARCKVPCRLACNVLKADISLLIEQMRCHAVNGEALCSQALFHM